MARIGEVQSFPSGFTKREFVVTTAADKYPQDLKFEIVKDEPKTRVRQKPRKIRNRDAARAKLAAQDK